LYVSRPGARMGDNTSDAGVPWGLEVARGCVNALDRAGEVRTHRSLFAACPR
jgi:hypothetical protein